MITITTEIIVEEISNTQIFDWILYLTPEKYRQWDPIAHGGKIERPDVLKVGDKIRFEEIIDGYKVNFRWVIKILDRPNLLLMKAKIPYPVFLQISFFPLNSSSKVIHEIRIGFRFFGLEKIVDWFITCLIMPQKKLMQLEDMQ